MLLVLLDLDKSSMVASMVAKLPGCVLPGLPHCVFSCVLVLQVVRLEGTNVEAGKQILGKSDIKIIAADDLDDAATKAVAAIKA